MSANTQIMSLALEMTANTSQAKQQLQELQGIIDNLTKSTLKGDLGKDMSKSLLEATAAAGRLKSQLEEATNVKTGQLDLGKLSNSFKESGVTLEDYRKQFNKLGPEGTAAFNKIATSVTQASAPIKQTSTLVDGLLINLKKVASWQISSSILHGFMGAISGAYQYAQDLNKSLNNIRIVTGQSTAEMAKFAEQANKSAKALSTTTTEYTDAALIFYQQGLSGKEVKDRTDVVMKMSNVTGQSATEISNQMTAIWNNFDDGSESLEHYADVITNLGAHTASSSKEIAEGLEKFAAIGDTVGLSYEYATTALATVVAETRQSADTVGTAFKTIFSRLQGLKLGETLDDGTDLNKYSEALQTVGVNIKEADGQLRNMDEILYDLGGKWQTLEKDQKMALAQTVAGTRQYTQLVALMDNWGEFQSNLDYANNADNTLQNQQDTYAESWEAASKRVQAAAQDMYNALIDDDFFILLTNLTADLINGFTAVIKTMGGLPQLLLTIGPLLMNHFGPEMAKHIDNFTNRIKTSWSTLKQFKKDAEPADYEKTRTSAYDAMSKNVTQLTEGDDSYSQSGVVSGFTKRLELQQKFAEISENLTEGSKKYLQVLLDINDVLNQNLQEQEKIAAEQARTFNTSVSDVINSNIETDDKEGKSKAQKAFNSYESASATKSLFEEMKTPEATLEAGAKNANKLTSVFDKLAEEAELFNQELQESEEQLEAAYGTEGVALIKDFATQVSEAKKSIEGLSAASTDLETNPDEFDNKYLIQEGENAGTYDTEAIASDYGIDPAQLEGFNGKVSELQDRINELKQSTIEGVNQIYESARQGVTDTAQEVDAVQEEIVQKYDETAKEIQDKFDNIDFSNGKSGKKKEIIPEKVKTQIHDTAQELSKLTGKPAKDIETQLTKRFESMGKSVKSSKAVAEALKDEVSKIAAEGKKSKIEEPFKKAKTEAEKMGNTTAGTTKKIHAVALSEKEIAEEAEKAGEKAQTLGRKISAIASATMAVGALINGFKNLASVWSSDASIGEKLLSTLTTLGSMTMSLTSLIARENVQMLTSLGLRIKNTIASLAKTRATIAETGATEAQTAANVGLLATMPPILVAVLAITAALLVLVGIVFIIVTAFEAWKKSTPEEKLKETRKASKELEDQLESTKKSAESLKNAFNEYDTAIDKLKECTKGTKEWEEALQEANNKALELQELDPSIILKRNADGLLEVAEESREAAEKAANKKVNIAQLASYQGKQDVKNQQLAVDIKDLAQNKIHPYGEGWEKVGDIVGFLSGAWGATTALNEQRERNEQDAIGKVIEAISKDNSFMDSEIKFTEELQELGISNQALIDSLYENKNELQNLSKTVATNTKTRETQNAEMAKQILDNTDDKLYKGYKYSVFQNEIAMVAGRQMDENTEKIKQDILNNLNQSSFMGARTEDKKKTIMYFQQATGMNFTKDDITDAEGQSIKIKVTNEKGEQEEKEFSRETIAQTIAAAVANEKLAKSGEALAKTFEDLKNAGNKSLIKFLSNQNFDNVKKGEFTDVKSKVIDSNGKVDNTKLNDYLNKQLGGDDGSLSEDEAKALGFDSVEALKKSFKEGVEKAEEAWKDTGIDDNVSADIAERMSLEQAKGVEQNFKKIVGKEGKQALSDAYSEMLSGLDDEKFEQVVNVLNEVDWSSYNAIDQLKSKISELGININLTDEEWEKLSAQIQKANGSLPIGKFQQLNDTLTAINTVSSDLKIGDEISQKDYKTLVGINNELSRYFTMTSNGKYKVIDDSFKNDIGFLSDAATALKEYQSVYEDVIKTTGVTKRVGSKKEVGINAYIEEHTGEKDNFLDDSSSDKAKNKRKELWKDIENDDQYNSIKNKILKELKLSPEDLEGNDDNLKQFFQAYGKILAQGAEEGFDSTQIIEAMKKSIKDVDDLNAVMSSGHLVDEEYGQVLDSILVNTAEDFGESSTMIRDYATNLQELAESSDAVADSLKNDDISAKKAALALTRMNQGANDLNSNIDKYKEALGPGKQATMAFAKEVSNAKKDIGNLLNIDGTKLSNSFFTSAKNLELMEKAAEGNTEAITKLRKAAADDIITNIKAEIDDKEIIKQVDSLHKDISNYLMENQDLAIGVELDDTQFIQACNDMIKNAEMTAEEATNYFAAMGYDAELNIAKKEVKSHRTIKRTIVDKKSGKKTEEEENETITDEISVPTVKTLTYNGSAGGNVTINESGSSSSGGSDSGGSGSSSKSNEEKKDLEDELERYHVINKQIDAQTSKLDALSKAKDRAYGKDRLKIMNAEIKAQKQALQLEQKKAKEVEKNMIKDAGIIKSFGAKISKTDGTIINYKAMMAKEVANYNKAVDKYNASSQEEADKNALDKAKKRFEDFKKYLSNYEESVKTAQDQAAEIATQKALILQKKLETIDYKLQVRVEIDDRKLAKLQKQMEKLQNVNFAQAKQIANLAKQANVLMDQSKATRQAMKETVKTDLSEGIENIVQDNAKKKVSKKQMDAIKNGKMSKKDMKKLGLSDKNIAQIKARQLTPKQLEAVTNGIMSKKDLKKLGLSNDTIEQLKKYRDELESYNEQMEEMKKQIPDIANSFMDQYLDKMKKATKEIEHQKQLMQNMQTIADLLGPMAGLPNEDKVNGKKALVTNAQSNIRAQIATRDTAKQEYEQYKAAYEMAKKAGKIDDETRQKWEDNLEARKTAWEEAELDVQQATINGLQVVQDAYKTQIQLILEEAKKAAEEAQKTYNTIKEERDRYLQDYKKMYETSKLMRSISQDIDKTDNLKAQKAYNDLLQEVAAYQQDGQQMSKYDLEYLQKKYALTQAQIALEEARNAKNQVRLSRDSEGNFGYVYTADTSKVDKAEQTYEDKLYALQDFVAKSTDELTNQWVQAEQKMYQEIEAIETNMTLSAEEKVAKRLEIERHYNEMRQFYAGELDQLMEHGKEINTEYVGYVGGQNDLMATNIHDTIFGKIYPDFDSFNDLYINHKDFLENTINPQLDAALSTYEKNIKDTCRLAGIDIKNFSTTYTNMANNVSSKSKQAAKSVEDMRDKQSKEYDKIKTQLENWYKNVEKNVNKVITKNENAANSVDKITTAYNTAKIAADNAATSFDKAAAAANRAAAAQAKVGKDSGGGADGNSLQGDRDQGTKQNPTNYKGLLTSSYDYGVYWINASESPLTKKEVNALKEGIVTRYTEGMYMTSSHGTLRKYRIKTDTDIYDVWASPTTISSFGIPFKKNAKTTAATLKTGGYTGEWGADGKMAVLHEKELVLNQSDTKNILTIVDIVRKVVQDINQFTKIPNNLRSIGLNNNQQEIQQKVEIKAEFPNVQNHNEIEQAFENLVNKAAQFANLK